MFATGTVTRNRQIEIDKGIKEIEIVDLTILGVASVINKVAVVDMLATVDLTRFGVDVTAMVGVYSFSSFPQSLPYQLLPDFLEYFLLSSGRIVDF